MTTDTRAQTQVAIDAAKIRAAYKDAGIKAQITSSNYSMGSSITVRVLSGDMTKAKALAKGQETVRRCEVTHEILGGGNQFVDVAWHADTVRAMAQQVGINVRNAFTMAEGHTLEPIADTSLRIERSDQGQPIVWGLFGRSVCREAYDIDAAVEIVARALLDAGRQP